MEELKREIYEIRASLIQLRIDMEEKKKMIKVEEADALRKLQELQDRKNSLLLEDNKLAALDLELLPMLEKATEKELQEAKDQLNSIEEDKRAMKEALLSAKKFDSYQEWKVVVEHLMSEFLGSTLKVDTAQQLMEENLYD